MGSEACWVIKGRVDERALCAQHHTLCPRDKAIVVSSVQACGTVGVGGARAPRFIRENAIIYKVVTHK